MSSQDYTTYHQGGHKWKKPRVASSDQDIFSFSADDRCENCNVATHGEPDWLAHINSSSHKEQIAYDRLGGEEDCGYGCWCGGRVKCIKCYKYYGTWYNNDEGCLRWRQEWRAGNMSMCNSCYKDWCECGPAERPVSIMDRQNWCGTRVNKYGEVGHDWVWGESKCIRCRAPRAGSSGRLE